MKYLLALLLTLFILSCSCEKKQATALKKEDEKQASPKSTSNTFLRVDLSTGNSKVSLSLTNHELESFHLAGTNITSQDKAADGLKFLEQKLKMAVSFSQTKCDIKHKMTKKIKHVALLIFDIGCESPIYGKHLSLSLGRYFPAIAKIDVEIKVGDSQESFEVVKALGTFPLTRLKHAKQ